MRNSLVRRTNMRAALVVAPLAAAALLVAVPAAQARPGQPPAGTPGGVQQRLAAISAKVNGLIGRMTLAEKFGQLEMSGPTGPNGTPGTTLLDEVRKGQVGSVLDLVGVANINQVQKAALQSRLHIPVIFALDVIHGYKTIFPVPLAEASSWDPAAVENDEAISADEATADGIKWTFNPMVDISRDPRWGRVVEGAGEDPFLGAAMAAAKVRGYQGSDFSAPDKMAATVKHFAAYGAPVAGREYNTVDMSTQQLFNDYLPPYKAAVDAGAASVMSAFNSLNGVPSSANPYLLQHDPAPRVGVPRHGGERLPGDPGAHRLRLRGQRRGRRAAGADRRCGHRDGRAGPEPVRHLPRLRPRARAQRQGQHGHDRQRRAPRADPEVPGGHVHPSVHRPDPGAARRTHARAPRRGAHDGGPLDGAAQGHRPRAAAEHGRVIGGRRRAARQ